MKSIQNPRQHRLKKRKKKLVRNTWIWSACIRISDGDFFLGGYGQAQNAPTPITTYALFCDGDYVTNEQMNDKKFLKLVNANL